MASAVAKKDYNYLIGETDATVWAKAWLEIIAEFPEVPHDEGTMIGWFANAIQSGIMSVENRGVVEDFLNRNQFEVGD